MVLDFASNAVYVRKTDLLLRIPHPERVGFLHTVCIADYAGRSLREQKELLEFISSAKVVHELIKYAGKCVVGFDLSVPLEKNLWKSLDFETDSLSDEKWESHSIAEQKKPYEQNYKDWRAGGWKWEEEENCWCMPLYLMGSSSAQEKGWSIASMRLTPCILTLWHWDHPLEQEHYPELKEQDLWFFLETMGKKSAQELYDGVAQYQKVSSDLRQQFVSWQERKMLENLLESKQTGGVKSL